MNVSLTPELEKFVHKKVISGRYTSASEVVREALRLLEEHEKIKEVRLQDLRNAIDEGWEAAERGKLIDGPAALESLLTRVQKKAKANKKRA